MTYHPRMASDESDLITSRENRWLKRFRAALRGSGPAESEPIGVEGPKLVEDALRSGLEAEALLVSESAEPAARNDFGGRERQRSRYTAFADLADDRQAICERGGNRNAARYRRAVPRAGAGNLKIFCEGRPMKTARVPVLPRSSS